MQRTVRREVREKISHGLFLASAAVAILVIASIFVFVGSQAYETFTVHHVNPAAFFTGTIWQPHNGQVGALVILAGSVLTTVVAVLLSAPISIGVAIFIAEVAPPWARRLMQPVLELFLGIPSIIYGFLGLVVLVPLVADLYNAVAGGYLSNGYGLVPAALVLAVMILPTITTLSADALRALPDGLREASAALGATRWQTIRRTLLPAASAGIVTSIILGTGRAIGETLAVSFVIGGNPDSWPFSFGAVFPYIDLHPTSTITVQLLFDFLEVQPGSLDYDALWTLAFILLLISLALVLVSRWVAARGAFHIQAS